MFIVWPGIGLLTFARFTGPLKLVYACLNLNYCFFDIYFRPPPPGFIPFRKASNLPKYAWSELLDIFVCWRADRIQKRWKWEGQLFIIKEDDQEELVGSVVCTNVTTPKTGGMRIPLTFDAMSRLNLISFHESSDVLIFLEACKTSDQFATLAGRDTESQLQVKTIASYMSKYEQVCSETLFSSLSLSAEASVGSSCASLVREQCRRPPLDFSPCPKGPDSPAWGPQWNYCPSCRKSDCLPSWMDYESDDAATGVAAPTQWHNTCQNEPPSSFRESTYSSWAVRFNDRP